MTDSNPWKRFLSHLEDPHQQPLRRFVAKACDFALVYLVVAILPLFLGPIIGVTYFLLSDAIAPPGFLPQSLGKQWVRLTVVDESGHFPSFRHSLVRNSPLAIFLFFSLIPFWGWLIALLLGAPLIIIEAFLVLRVQSGARLGDIMAHTRVIETAEPGWMRPWLQQIRNKKRTS